MAKNVLVIETDDQGQFYLSLANGTLSLGDHPNRVEVQLRDLTGAKIRCEIAVDGDTVHLTRPAGAGQPAVQKDLHTGQAVRLTHSRLHLEPLSKPKTPEPSQAPPAPAAPPSPPKPAAVTEGTFRRLRVIDGADMGRAFRLPDSGTTTIGKSSKHADIILHDLYVSRVHCEIKVEPDKVLVRHWEGDNGTLINGTRITGEQELPLGAVLRVGNSHLRLETALTLDHSGPVDEENADEDRKTQDTSDAEEAAHELIGTVLGHYQILELLGQGFSGEVFGAQDDRNQHIVTLKVLAPSFPANGAELQKFVQAMKVVAHHHHPHLVAVHAAGRSGNHCWIVRDYVEGESAASYVNRCIERDSFNWKKACRIAVHLGRVLEFLHKQRIFHGNITLANILLADDKTTKLADLMLANALEGSELQKSFLEEKLLAELPYLAPEQTYPDAFVDHLADLYALGAVLYTLLTGKAPFSGKDAKEIIEQIQKAPLVRPTAYQKKIPPVFETAVLKLMARHQEDRFQSASELLASLEPITEEYDVEV